MAYAWRRKGYKPNTDYCKDREIMDMNHIMLYPGAEDCAAKHSRYVWPAMEHEAALILSDSLLKRIRYLKIATVHAIPGAKIERFTSEIRRGKISVYSQRAILVHLGTNNLSRDTAKEIRDKMETLIDTIRAKNPSCKILVSGIIMRPQDEKSDIKYTRKGDSSLAQKRRDANTLMEGMLRKKRGFLMKSWVPLMTGPIPNPGMYYKDGLHLSDRGVARFTEYMILNLGRFLPKVPAQCPTRMGLI
jgi:lysophospholipase L1-like esterase